MGRSNAAARLPLILERFKRAMNIKPLQHDKTISYSFRMPGFKYDDFDRAGLLNMVKINRMMETNRVAKWEWSTIKNIKNLTFFMFGTHLHASKTLYRTAAFELPMKFHVQMSRVGESSIDLVNSFIEEETNTVLAQRISRVVNINSNTKKAVPLPEETRSDLQKMLSKTSKNLELPHFIVPALVPERCFIHEVVVRYADLDFMFHANQGSYLLYAFECATRAAAEGFYSRIHEDICYYPAKTASGIHVAESFAGDILQVMTWEDHADPMSIYFVIRCKDKDIYYAKVEFYDEQDFNRNGASAE